MREVGRRLAYWHLFPAILAILLALAATVYLLRSC